MTTGQQRQSHTEDLNTDKSAANKATGHSRSSLLSSEASSRMFMRTLLLFCVVIFFCADAEGSSSLHRRPSCVGMSRIQACPLNYSPVCGSNGVTYPNECSLCIYRLETNTDILIVKDGPC